MFCGDLFTHTGERPALTSDDLSPATLALMHGSSFAGDTRQALRDLADLYDGWLRSAAGDRP